MARWSRRARAGTGPQWYMGGASPAALDLAGRLGDVLLMWIQPLDATAKLMDGARAAFETHGRQARFGLRTHLVVRDTEEDAWDAAEELLSRAEASVQDQRSSQVQGTPMAGAAIQARRYEQHRVGERLWNGISTVRVNCGTAIVGTPEQAADGGRPLLATRHRRVHPVWIPARRGVPSRRPAGHPPSPGVGRRRSNGVNVLGAPFEPSPVP